MGGPLWSVMVPALLFLVATLATYLLYRRFSAEAGREKREEGEERMSGAGSGPEPGAP